MFEVIDGTKKEKPDYHSLYTNAFLKCLNRIIDLNIAINGIDLPEKKRFIYYGIKMINAQKTKDLDHEEHVKRLQRMDVIKTVISTLTPDEFENIFPIEKDYDGARYQTKDYFFVRKALNEVGRNKEIGDNLEKILWDYMNIHVMNFNVNTFSTIDDIRRSHGEKSLASTFFEEKGIDTYTMYNDEKGKQFLQNNTTGEVTAVKKPKPRYLNVVK